MLEYSCMCIMHSVIIYSILNLDRHHVSLFREQSSYLNTICTHVLRVGSALVETAYLACTIGKHVLCAYATGS
jgi:hypothetical protein